MPKVIIIDDQSITRMILQELVRSIEQNIHTTCFADPLEALEWAKHNEVDLVITDYKMPHMNGTEFISHFRRLPDYSDIPIMIVTCIEDDSVRHHALESGASDLITKPIDHIECRARCRNLLTISQQRKIIKDSAFLLDSEIRHKTQEPHQCEQETLMRLAKVGEHRDDETGSHIIRISRYSRLIAEGLGLSKDNCDLIFRASPMHDIGKIAIPDDILLKPARLTEKEFKVMQRHAQFGYDILKGSPSKYLQTGAIIALGHHEKYNGNGYPQSLKGEQIPLQARIVAVADVFDALVTKRPYKESWPLEKAFDLIKQERGGHFDPDCADLFLQESETVTSIHHELAEND